MSLYGIYYGRGGSTRRFNQPKRSGTIDIMLQKLDKDKAYVLGFFHADGCYGINRKRYYVHGEEKLAEQAYFHIGSVDKEVIEFISRIIGIPMIVSEDPRKASYKTYYRINSHNKEITKDLEYHGYCEKKSLHINHFPIIPEELMPDFIRGFFDGDGSVTCAEKSRKVRLFITEATTLEAISEYLDRHSIRYSVHVYKEPIIEMSILSKSWLDFYNLIYNGGFKLQRKYETYTKIVCGIVSTCSNVGEMRMK